MVPFRDEPPAPAEVEAERAGLKVEVTPVEGVVEPLPKVEKKGFSFVCCFFFYFFCYCLRKLRNVRNER
jgi:hypothetical protein